MLGEASGASRLKDIVRAPLVGFGYPFLIRDVAQPFVLEVGKFGHIRKGLDFLTGIPVLSCPFEPERSARLWGKMMLYDLARVLI